MKTLTALTLLLSICINPYRIPVELRKPIRGYQPVSVPGYFEKPSRQGLC